MKLWERSVHPKMSQQQGKYGSRSAGDNPGSGQGHSEYDTESGRYGGKNMRGPQHMPGHWSGQGSGGQGQYSHGGPNQSWSQIPPHLAQAFSQLYVSPMMAQNARMSPGNMMMSSPNLSPGQHMSPMMILQRGGGGGGGQPQGQGHSGGRRTPPSSMSPHSGYGGPTGNNSQQHQHQGSKH